MSRRGGLKATSEYTGLSEWELRTGALSGKYPSMRIGGARGKLWFDFDLMDLTIERLMLSNAAPIELEGQRGKIRAVK